MCGRVPPLAVLDERTSSETTLFGSHVDELNRGTVEELIEIAYALCTVPGFEHDRHFNEIGDRQRAAVGVLDGFVEPAALGFILQDYQ